MKCVACGKEKRIYSENVCKQCHDSYHNQLGEEESYEEFLELERRCEKQMQL